MGYVGVTAFLVNGELPEPTLEDLAKRLVWMDFARAKLTVVLGGVGGEQTGNDIAAALIARLLRQEVERAIERTRQEATVQPRNDPDMSM